jgi:DNA-binding transcriptional LysR family regulator
VYIDRLTAALPTDHRFAGKTPIPLKKLANEPFVVFHRQGAPGLFDEVVSVCRRAGFSPRIVTEPNLMQTVLTLVESRIGIALVPSCVHNLHHTEITFHPLLPQSNKIPLCLIRRRENTSPVVEAFCEIVREQQGWIRDLMEPKERRK